MMADAQTDRDGCHAERPVPPLRAGRLLVAFVCILAAGTACEVFEDPTPDSVRVVIDGTAGATVRIVKSTQFVAGVNSTTGVTRVEILASDTIAATLPFQRTYSISGDYQFFVEVSRMDADVSSFRLRVYVDQDLEFDHGGILIPGSPYRFLYQFNRFFTDVLEVTF
jgi:hypothetical protein